MDCPEDLQVDAVARKRLRTYRLAKAVTHEQMMKRFRRDPPRKSGKEPGERDPRATSSRAESTTRGRLGPVR